MSPNRVENNGNNSLDELVECLENFINQSLFVMTMAIGAVVLLAVYIMNFVTGQPQRCPYPPCLPERTIALDRHPSALLERKASAKSCSSYRKQRLVGKKSSLSEIVCPIKRYESDRSLRCSSTNTLPCALRKYVPATSACIQTNTTCAKTSQSSNITRKPNKSPPGSNASSKTSVTSCSSIRKKRSSRKRANTTTSATSISRTPNESKVSQRTGLKQRLSIPSLTLSDCSMMGLCTQKSDMPIPGQIATNIPNLTCLVNYFWTMFYSINGHYMAIATVCLVVLLSFMLPDISQKLHRTTELKAMTKMLDMMSKEVSRAEVACLTVADQIGSLHRSMHDDTTETLKDQQDLAVCTSGSLRATRSAPVKADKKLGFLHRLFLPSKNTSHKEIAIMSYVYTDSFDAGKKNNGTSDVGVGNTL